MMYTFNHTLEPEQVVPPAVSSGLGTVNGTYDDETGTLSFSLRFNYLTGPTTGANIYGPASPGSNAGVQVPLPSFSGGVQDFPLGVTDGRMPATGKNSYPITPAQAADLLAGLWYVSILTAAYPQGEIRAQLTL